MGGGEHHVAGCMRAGAGGGDAGGVAEFTIDRGVDVVTIRRPYSPLILSDEVSALPPRRARLRAGALEGVLGSLRSTVGGRCYAACPDSAQQVALSLQIFDDSGERWMSRRAPFDLLRGATHGEGLVALLKYLAERDRVWDEAFGG